MNKFIMCSWAVTVGAAMTTFVVRVGGAPWAFAAGSLFGSMLVTALHFMRRR